MARLSYMAIVCREPARLADYYHRGFAFDTLQRADNGTIYLTDGTMTVGLLQQGAANGETDRTLGLHHIGFQVESLAAVERRLRDLDPTQAIQPRPADDPFAEGRIVDPEGILVDLSERGYGNPGEKRVPGIRHVALANENPPRKFEFYRGLFGMRDVNRADIIAPTKAGKPPPRFAGDGYVNLALLIAPVTEPRPGFNHFGILTPDPRELMARIAAKDPTRLDQRPADRFAEYRIWDPEGNALDLSAHKGYQVDVDLVDRIA